LAAVAAAIERVKYSRHVRVRIVSGAALLLGAAHAGVLPDDRADLMYHSYEGGGLTVSGPSVLVQKKFGDNFSMSYNYYEDMISSASIDVITQASAYKETRKQNSLGFEAIHGKTTYSGGYIYSKEPDYKSQTAFANISQDMFGDLTTISFGYTRGWDRVGERGTTRDDPLDRRGWNVGLSQILTRNAVLVFNYEVTEGDGEIANPYRQVRYLDPQEPLGYAYQKEVYPLTRSGNAASATLKYYLPWRAAATGSYRFYSDTFGIRANTGEIAYTQPVHRTWTLDTHVRYYSQNHATFYSDLFPYANSQNFMARDRELAQFDSITAGVGATWEYHVNRFSWLQKGTVNVSFDRLHIHYDDFRDLRVQDVAPGTEPLYTLDADILQAFVSFWF
jgi:Protein of unknown function (DUF3570)